MVGIPDWFDQNHEPDNTNAKVNIDMRQERIKICENCPKISGFKFCKVCGCFLPVKTYFKFFDCPLEKWPKVD